MIQVTSCNLSYAKYTTCLVAVKIAGCHWLWHLVLRQPASERHLLMHVLNGYTTSVA